MATYYYEGAVISTPLEIRTNEPAYETDSISLKHFRTTKGAQRWEVSFRVIDSSVDYIAVLSDVVNNFHSKRTMIMPQLEKNDSRFTASTDTIALNASANAADTSVTLNTGAVTGVIPQGYFFKFSNHDKIYMTTADADMSGATTVVNFYPALRSGLTTSHNALLGDLAVLSYFQSTENLAGITYVDGILTEFGTVQLVEALQ